MRKSLFLWALGLLLTMPCVLCAEEIEIKLMEVISMGFIPGDDPLDGNDHMEPTPTRPGSFHATINGNVLSVTKQDSSIPSAQATVVRTATGGTVLNQQFTTTLSEQISTPGVYVLHIQTAGGALVGQFVVQ